ncbi:MAG: phosphonate ABC transporter ATP-binding protein [Chloroflexi bacterium]|nr:phosphonate ABC transporter ATP-binding protein [Chloroflexota bacterium]
MPGKIGTPVLQVEHVSKQYPGGRRALDDVSLVVAAGELVVVLGANGSGKSTLLRCVARLIEPTAGSVRVAGRDLAHLRGRELRKARLALAMIFQQPNLVRRRSALANVATGSLGRHQGLATAFGRLPRDALLDSAALLDRLGTLHLANKRADTLSGGEAQRVAIARALAQQPRVLLADEPVSSLDPEAAEDVLLLLAELATRDNLGIVCVLHQPELALRHAQRLVGLRHGRVTFDAPVARVDLESIAALYRSDQP